MMAILKGLLVFGAVIVVGYILFQFFFKFFKRACSHVDELVDIALAEDRIKRLKIRPVPKNKKGFYRTGSKKSHGRKV